MTEFYAEIIYTLFPLIGLFYLIFQAYTYLKWKDLYRKFAMAPLFITIPTTVFSIYALIENSNLWWLYYLAWRKETYG